MRGIRERVLQANDFRSRATCLILACLIAVWGASDCLAQSDRVTVLVGATVIDGNQGAPLKDAVVVIKGDRIANVGSRARVKYPKTAKVIDLRGKFILPGLIDMHVHYDGWMGELFLAHGVTTIKDLGNDAEWMESVSAEIREGKVRGPRIFYVGNGIDAPPPSRDHHIGVDDPETAKRAVKLLYGRGVSAIKVREKITPELLRAVVEQAHRLGIPVTGHIGRTDAREAALAGIDGLEHATGIVEATAKEPSEDKPDINTLEYFISELKAFSLIDEARAEELVKFLAQKGVALIPTMSNHWRMGSARRDEFARVDAEYAKKPELAYVPENIRQVWATSFLFKVKDAGDLAQIETGYKKLQRLLLKHYRAGGKVLAGSDTLLSVPGLSLQRELLFLVDAGLTPMEAISAATRDNARFLRKGDLIGTIQAGKLADLLILDADPLDKISNVFEVASVMKGGEWVDTSYHADYLLPTPKPKLTRPLWIEKLLQKTDSSKSRAK